MSRVFLPKRSGADHDEATARADRVEDRRSLVAHLKGRAVCINVVGYLGPLTIAIVSGSHI